MSWDFDITCGMSPKFLLMEIHKKMFIDFHGYKITVYIQPQSSKDDQKILQPSRSTVLIKNILQVPWYSTFNNSFMYFLKKPGEEYLLNDIEEDREKNIHIK